MKDDQNQELLIRYRLEQAESAIEEANLLISQGRTTLGAVNRAYYAMFYAVLALLQFINKIPRKHSGAIALFDAEPYSRFNPQFNEEAVSKEIISDSCLLCSEDKPDFCHRRLVAEYFQQHWGDVDISHLG